MKCFYHNDLDGRCAGAIVYRAVSRKDDWEFIEVDYKDEIDIDKIEDGEKIVIVDFSFEPEVMEKVLLKTDDIIWIDHHKTSFEYKYSRELDGLRLNEYSGCELAWKYFMKNRPIPYPVELIGDRDTWRWKHGTTTTYFNEGLKLYPHHPKDEIWDYLLSENEFLVFGWVKEIVEEGRTAARYRDVICEDYANNFGFETTFEGYRCFAIGLLMFGSQAFGERFDRYDICLAYEFLGDKWVVKLYSATVDVSAVAKKYGGGGHKGAAGFICSDLPFKKKGSQNMNTTPYQKAMRKAEKYFAEQEKKYDEREKRIFMVSWGTCPRCGSDLVQKKTRGLLSYLFFDKNSYKLKSRCPNCGFYDEYHHVGEDGLT